MKHVAHRKWPQSMEFLTILLSGLLGILSPAGFAVEQVATQAIRNQFDQVETLAVRIDSTPNYQLVQGKADRIRIAGRGLYPEANIRIAALEVETDAIAISPKSLQTGQPQLEKPLNAGIRLVLTREDINRALQSPEVSDRLRNLSLDLLGSPAQRLERYDFVNPQVDFLDNQRIRLQVTLQSQQTETQVTIAAETGIQIANGRQLQLVEPIAQINDRPLPPQFVNLLVGGISERFDLSTLEQRGITARILQWQIDRDQVSLAVFVSVTPEFNAASTMLPTPSLDSEFSPK